jgi:hypothetical protein
VADGEEGPVEAIIGVVLVVISCIEILWVIRTVQANMPKA